MRADGRDRETDLGFTYAELGAALLGSWQLPESIIPPVQHHVLDVAQMPSDALAEITVMQISAVIVRAAMWRSDADEPVLDFDPPAL